jgi:hypothetical protein
MAPESFLVFADAQRAAHRRFFLVFFLSCPSPLA